MRHPRPDYIPEGHIYTPIEFAAQQTHRRLARPVFAVIALMIMVALVVGGIVHVVDPDPPRPVPSRDPARPPATEGVR